MRKEKARPGKDLGVPGGIRTAQAANGRPRGAAGGRGEDLRRNRCGQVHRLAWTDRDCPPPGLRRHEVIDTSNGQVLADIQPTPAHQGCTTFKYPTFSVGKDGKRLGPTTMSTGISCDFGGATLFLSADATNTEPHVNQPARSTPQSYGGRSRISRTTGDLCC